MLVIPELLISVGHHKIHKFVDKSIRNLPVPHQVGKLHHYRECSGVRRGFNEVGNSVLDNQTIVDNSILKFKHVTLNSMPYKIYKKMHPFSLK